MLLKFASWTKDEMRMVASFQVRSKLPDFMISEPPLPQVASMSFGWFSQNAEQGSGLLRPLLMRPNVPRPSCLSANSAGCCSSPNRTAHTGWLRHTDCHTNSGDPINFWVWQNNSNCGLISCRFVSMRHITKRVASNTAASAHATTGGLTMYLRSVIKEKKNAAEGLDRRCGGRECARHRCVSG